ncbi:MAG TPA: D-alanyl-D-alanine carboxypeptidase [Puia sp.]|nr:D-alanyl-D-alanine carboxypeptidase [Puia sp.]
MKINCLRVLLLPITFLQSCSSFRDISKTAQKEILLQQDLRSAHIGISIFDVTTNAFLYNYQSEKYFVPASNTKLFSLYAGLKYLDDSLIGIRYNEDDTSIMVFPTGDPTLLHRDFIRQPVVDFLRKKNKNIYITDAAWKETGLGPGWSWDDYNDDYSVERSPMPVYGNFIQWAQAKDAKGSYSSFSVPDINWKVDFADSTGKEFFVKRNFSENAFVITQGTEQYKQQDVPFITDGLGSAIELLKDTVGKNIFLSHFFHSSRYPPLAILRSQPTDSLFKPMMYRSDNFFAEQTLLMTSNEVLGFMSDKKIIDTLLKSDLRDLPQKPVWVDGSGLSRYNLFSPQDFIFLLTKMQRGFGLERLKKILPTGGAGTLGYYYKKDSARIYAKTGSLSGVICLSGYLITKKNHLLVFSILINNCNGRGSVMRVAVARFLERILSNY